MGEETCPEADAGEGVRARAEAGVTAEAGAMAAAVATEATVAEEAAETVGAAAAGASTLFDGVSFGSLRAKNRFVRAATWEGLATDEGLSLIHIVSMVPWQVDGAWCRFTAIRRARTHAGCGPPHANGARAH